MVIIYIASTESYWLEAWQDISYASDSRQHTKSNIKWENNFLTEKIFFSFLPRIDEEIPYVEFFMHPIKWQYIKIIASRFQCIAAI